MVQCGVVRDVTHTVTPVSGRLETFERNLRSRLADGQEGSCIMYTELFNISLEVGIGRTIFTSGQPWQPH
jgi:hypothetical protein